LHLAQGDLNSARARFQGSLDIVMRLVTANPGSTSLQRDVSVGLSRLGEVLLAQGDPSSARARFQNSLDIASRLAAASPKSAELQRDLWVVMWQLRRFPDSGIAWTDVANAMQDMQTRGTLFPNDRKFLEEAQRQAQAESQKGKQP